MKGKQSRQPANNSPIMRRRETPIAYKTPPQGGIAVSPLHKIVDNRYFSYARMTLEDRAIPDFRDGLIPVYRRILWAMYRLNNHHTGRTLKKARIVGDTMGKYHPHGDISISNAMSEMSQQQAAVPLLHGHGNWGNFTEKAGAMRYIECRLSEYSDKVLLDPYYLKAITKIPSYDGRDEEPLYLPALLPNLLLFGVQGGIAVGTTSMFPPFHSKGVQKLVNLALSGKTITPQLCHHYLEMNYRWGGKIVSSNDEMINFYTTGEQTLYFSCDYTVEGKVIHITGIPPRWNYENNIEKLQDHDSVASVKQLSKAGVNVIVTVKDADLKTFQKVERILQSYLAARTNVTMRYAIKGTVSTEAGAEFKATNIPTLLHKWSIWRLALERRAIGLHLKELRSEIHRFNLLRRAIDHLDAIVKILRSREAKASIEQQLMGLMHISLEDARYIFDQRVRRLAYLSGIEIDNKIKELKIEHAAMEQHLLNPTPLVIEKTNKLFLLCHQ